MKRSGKIAIAAGASVLVLGAGVGVASAATSDSGSPAPSSSASAAPSHQDRQHSRRAGVLRRVEHGVFTLAGRRHRTVDVQRGEVQSVSATSVTVKSRDGYTHRYAVDAHSRVRKDRERSSIGRVAKGDRVWVVAEHSGSTVLRLGDRGQ
ncbi:MAG TPA: hypothetical protein VF053_17660 [Streptosporangiales bacterium]